MTILVGAYPVHGDLVNDNEAGTSVVFQRLVALSQHTYEHRLRKFSHAWPCADAYATPGEHEQSLRVATLPGEWRAIPFLWQLSPNCEQLDVTLRGTLANQDMEVHASLDSEYEPGTSTTVSTTGSTSDLVTHSISIPQHKRGKRVRVDLWFQGAADAVDGNAGAVTGVPAVEAGFGRFECASWPSTVTHSTNPYVALKFADTAVPPVADPWDEEFRLVLSCPGSSNDGLARFYPALTTEQAGLDFETYTISVMSLESVHVQERGVTAPARTARHAPGRYLRAPDMIETVRGLNRMYRSQQRVFSLFPHPTTDHSATRVFSGVSNVELGEWYLPTPASGHPDLDMHVLYSPLYHMPHNLGTMDPSYEVTTYWTAGRRGSGRGATTWVAGAKEVKAPCQHFSATYPIHLADVGNTPNPLEGRLRIEELRRLVVVSLTADYMPTYTAGSYPYFAELRARGWIADMGAAVHSVLIVSRPST